MWLVVGGPLVVVVAALVTAVIAHCGADPVVDEPAAAATRPDAGTAAMRARNHAATALAASASSAAGVGSRR